jgi:hypothetical protein
VYRQVARDQWAACHLHDLSLVQPALPDLPAPAVEELS